MKNRIFAIILSFILSLSLSTPALAQGYPPEISAECAVLMEAESREIVFEKNGSTPCSMASTTKIMTALVVLETLPLSHVFTVDDSAVGTEGTSAYLEKGDTMTVEAALYALLLQSANDAANALAIEAGDSVEGFASLMNSKARELSLNATRFANPSGLPAEDHYTTARDLAALAAVCLENEDFCRIASTKSITVTIGEKERTFVNHNKLLSLYDGAIGVKTGFTKESGRCLVGAAERDGVRLISVTLSAPDDWNDHRAMLDMGFELYRRYTLCRENEFLIALPVAGRSNRVCATASMSKEVTLKKDSAVNAVIEAERFIYAPALKGQKVGCVIFYSKGKELCRIPLVVKEDVN